MATLAKANIWIVVPERNLRAYQGIYSSIAFLEAATAEISPAVWNGGTRIEGFSLEVNKMISDINNVMYTVFSTRTVVPKTYQTMLSTIKFRLGM